MTLVEILVSVAVLSVVLAGAYAVMSAGLRLVTQNRAISGPIRPARNLVDRLNFDLKESLGSVTGVTYLNRDLTAAPDSGIGIVFYKYDGPPARTTGLIQAQSTSFTLAKELARERPMTGQYLYFRAPSVDLQLIDDLIIPVAASSGTGNSFVINPGAGVGTFSNPSKSGSVTMVPADAPVAVAEKVAYLIWNQELRRYSRFTTLTTVNVNTLPHEVLYQGVQTIPDVHPFSRSDSAGGSGKIQELKLRFESKEQAFIVGGSMREMHLSTSISYRN